MKNLFYYSLFLLCIVSLCGSCSREPTNLTLIEAQKSGAAAVTVRGINVEQIHIEISSMYPGTITIPVGTVFASSSTGTQNMMTARTVQVVFPGPSGQTYDTPQIQSIDLEAYCLNRMLDAPTDNSSFTAISSGGELDSVRHLAACLEKQDADHDSRQLAIWMTSDHFLDMSEAEVRKRLRDHAEELLTSEKSMTELRRALPNISEELIEELIQGIRNTPEFREIVHQAFSEEIDKEIDLYKTKARFLLEQCHFDLAAAKFFQN